MKHDNHLYPAYTRLGFVLRKGGRLQESRIAYQNALFIEPDVASAIEDFAETYLHLRRFDSVKSAYWRLSDLEPEYAAPLSRTIENWLQQQAVTGDSGLERFARWLERGAPAVGDTENP